MKRNMTTHADEMKDQLLETSRKRFTGSILKSPGKRIPAVSKVTIETKDYNSMLEEIGILHKLPPTIKMERNPNHRLNRYIGHQIIRMRTAKDQDNHKLFGVVANACLRSSVSFRLSAINHVIPNGGFGISVGRVYQINRGVNGILNEYPKQIDFKRVYIPKKNDKGRPLGVPNVEGRIALHMLNNMIILFFEGSMLSSQHAYIPGRGTKTAGQDVVNKVIKSKGIYETDLQGFFDNISIFEIYDKLRLAHVPTKIISGVYALSKSIPKLPEDVKLDESKYDTMTHGKKLVLSREIIQDLLTHNMMFLSKIVPRLSKETFKILIDILDGMGVSIWDKDAEFDDSNLDDYFEQPGSLDLSRETLEKLIETNSPLLSSELSKKSFNLVLDILQSKGVSIYEPVKSQKEDNYLKQKLRLANLPGGVPQGAPHSPFLAIIGIRDYLSQQSCVNYADDQIFYGDKPFTIQDDKANGIIHNTEKCDGIRKDGVGLKELKFLGLVYNPGTGEVRSETRAGRTARIENSLIELGEDISYDDDTTGLENMANKNFFGFVMSCLYNGSGKAEKFATKERQVNKNSFLQRYVNSRVLSSAVLEVLGGKIDMKSKRKLQKDSEVL